MENFISMFEIPAVDFNRAVSFYSAILNIDVEEMDIDGIKMGVFPNDGKNVSGAVIKGTDYKPSTNGVMVYLNGGDDLQVILNKVATNNGKVIVPKTQISPELGFYGMFIDTEGNRVGVYSMN